MFTCSAGLTKLTTFFRVLEAWCHCDFRKMEVLKVNKFGRTYRTGTQAVQARREELYYDYQLNKARQSLVTTF